MRTNDNQLKGKGKRIRRKEEGTKRGFNRGRRVCLLVVAGSGFMSRSVVCCCCVCCCYSACSVCSVCLVLCLSVATDEKGQGQLDFFGEEGLVGRFADRLIGW